MNHLRFKGITDDATQEGKCSDDELAAMLEVFSEAVISVAATRARSATFELADFKDAVKHGLKDFRLTIECAQKDDVQEWIGSFERNGRRKVRIIGCLEKK